MALDIQSVSEIIGGVVTLVTAVGGFILRYHRTVVKRYKRDKETACGDIAFLLALEAKYIVALKEKEVKMEPSIKVAMRDKVRAQGLEFSGKFTPGRVAGSRATGFKPAIYRIRATLEAMGEAPESA